MCLFDGLQPSLSARFSRLDCGLFSSETARQVRLEILECLLNAASDEFEGAVRSQAECAQRGLSGDRFARRERGGSRVTESPLQEE